MTMDLLYFTGPFWHNTFGLNVTTLLLMAIPHLLRASPWALQELPTSLLVQASSHLLHNFWRFLCLYMDSGSLFVKIPMGFFVLNCPFCHQILCQCCFKTPLQLFALETMPAVLNVGKFWDILCEAFKWNQQSQFRNMQRGNKISV